METKLIVKQKIMTAKEKLLRFVFDNEFITKPSLKDKFELLVNEVIEEAARRVDEDFMSAGNAKIPEWVTEETKSDVLRLWNSENINHSNPRVRALELIREDARKNGYTISIKKGADIIHEIIK